MVGYFSRLERFDRDNYKQIVTVQHVGQSTEKARSTSMIELGRGSGRVWRGVIDTLQCSTVGLQWN